ncbi:MAG: hypothetical protein HFI94_04675 [Lachnospiraceae bacterium]|jgi:hypothetical protein|nr:hypothetical protein [Lachnospiraceae bacterium]
MRVLVLWRKASDRLRNTIIDHAFCFQRYDKENEYFYFNIFNGRRAEDYEWIEQGLFDAVIFHYSALSLRTSEKHWGNFHELMSRVWRDDPCVKVFLPQDDYSCTARIWELANEIKADKIYSVIREEDYSIIYPKDKIGNIDIETVLTGYIEESYLNTMSDKPHIDRKYDVVYRARKLPYEYGKLGQLKSEIADVFKEKLSAQRMRIDIANTNDDGKAILGDAWIDFLASSRMTIGCLGGSGFMDADGMLKKSIERYILLHPNASFEETKTQLFPEKEDNLHGMLSPRIFECAINHTCQILVGDNYHGIIEADKDYIMVKQDFSNIDEVIDRMKDIAYCENIAENCYNKLVKSEQYTYRKFAQKVSDDIKDRIRIPHNEKYDSTYIEVKCRSNNCKADSEIQELLLRGN